VRAGHKEISGHDTTKTVTVVTLEFEV
jgi:hypothetical protein